MNAYLPKFGDLVAYCLMPNHFHWLFYLRNVEVDRESFYAHLDLIEYQRRVSKYGEKAHPVESSKSRTSKLKTIDFNEAIGTLERAYTSAINKEKNWTGSLLQKECKSKDGWVNEVITEVNEKGKIDHRFYSGSEYGLTCLNYIHLNPVKAQLVKDQNDWEYSSARDFAGLRQGRLCNIKRGKEIMGME